MSSSMQEHGTAAMNVISNALEVASKHKTLLMFAGSWMAWMFSILSLAKCNFMTTSQDEQLGLLSRSYVDEDGQWLGCVKYTTSDGDGDGDGDGNDSLLKVGRAFSVMTVLFTSLSVSFLSVVTMSKQPAQKSRIFWKVAHCSLVAAALSQMLAFVALGSERCHRGGCSLTGVGVLAIFNAVLLDLLGFVWLFLPAPSIAWISWWEDTDTEDADANRHKQTMQATNDQISSDDPQQAPRRMEAVEEAESVISASSQGSDESSEVLGSIQDLISFRLTTVVLIFVAWVVSLLGVSRCTFLVVGPKGDSQSNFSGLGLYSQAVDNSGVFLGCVAYPDHSVDEFDGSFRTARAFGAMTTLLTTGIFMLSIVQLFLKRFVRECWHALRAMIPASACTQLVTFAAFDSDLCSLQGQVECHPGGTGIVVILNVFLMVALSALVLLIPAPRSPLFTVLKLADQAEKRQPDNNGARSAVRISTASTERPCRRQGHLDVETDDDSDHDEVAASNMIRRHPQLSPRLQEGTADTAMAVASITVKVEYTATGKKTIKILTHVDGSQTITTTIEEVVGDDSSEAADDMTEDGYRYCG